MLRRAPDRVLALMRCAGCRRSGGDEQRRSLELFAANASLLTRPKATSAVAEVRRRPVAVHVTHSGEAEARRPEHHPPHQARTHDGEGRRPGPLRRAGGRVRSLPSGKYQAATRPRRRCAPPTPRPAAATTAVRAAHQPPALDFGLRASWQLRRACGCGHSTIVVRRSPVPLLAVGEISGAPFQPQAQRFNNGYRPSLSRSSSGIGD